MKAKTWIWTTADGELTKIGDPRAALCIAEPGDDVPPEYVDAVQALMEADSSYNREADDEGEGTGIS